MTHTFSGYTGTWCPGCGDWGISLSIKNALAQLGKSPSSVAVVFDIGCSGNMNDVLNAYAIHSLHGRSIPPAIGMKIANHNQTVLVIGGDGGIFGEGSNHFIHACRGNHDITVIVHDNSVYGLTKGQVAPTAFQGFVAKSTPMGLIEHQINPLLLAVSNGASFVAQGFAGDTDGVVDLIKRGINHKGFSFINILQPCVTFNKINTYQYYYKHIYKLSSDYDVKNYEKAVVETLKLEQEQFPIGVVYEMQKKAFHEYLPQVAKVPLIQKEPYKAFNELLNEFVA
jgi:2-oxoglutarate/2-oxoacid ferredoxin oxidoreductase subunit beta